MTTAGARRPRCVVIGGGLAGALAAVCLARRGWEVEVHEMRPDPRLSDGPRGRSINLAISARGIDALARVGLAEAIMRHAVPMRGRMVHDANGARHFQPYDKDPSRCINSISRAGLNVALLEAAAREPGARVHYGHKCVEVDLDAPAAEFVDADGTTARAEGDLLLGADGAFSVLRRRMQRMDRFDYSQDYLSHGYKELCIPPAPAGGFALEPNALHIWPRRSFMMIALPNEDGSFTCTLFAPFQGPNGFDSLREPAQARAFFTREFADALPLMPTLVDDFFANPTSSLVTVRCAPWHHGGMALLIGDAAHAVVPFYGQGMNAAFEDVVALDDCLARAGDDETDRERAFRELHARRKPNVDALADLAIANFLEMRDHVGTASFRRHKAIERALHRFLPFWYVPLYTMVSFTLTPYAEAIARARRQDRLARWLAAILFVAAVAAVLAATAT
ncbi:MAG: FAD-dependent monooxygenase [Planctomycetes bacterium]|nr:FAD-dependent monooxygenase [Planctomycetota bacterium]